MLITSCGRGVHQRELKGVDYLSTSLPDAWYGFSNLDLVLDLGRAREVDLVIVADHRIFLVDLKDWYGEIESRDGRWFLNGVDKDPSPVTKVTGIARDLGPILSNALRKFPDTKALIAPRIEGLVVLTGNADIRKVADVEKAKVLTDREFVRKVAGPQAQRAAFGNVAEQFLKQPLTERVWRSRLRQFFNAGPSSPFKHGRRRFQQFVADDASAFVHPLDIYREYAAPIDRLLVDVKIAASGGRRRRAGFYSAIRRVVPIRTFNDWNSPVPGFCEVDMVAHGGTSVAGSFIQTLTMVDVATGWTECRRRIGDD